MRRLLAALALLLVPAMAALLTPALAQEHVVNFYNWTDYIDPKVLEQFTAQTGIKVQYDVYDSLETLEGKLLAGHSGYDIVVPTSEPTFSRLIAAKALQVLDRSKLPNFAGLDPKLMARVQSSDPGNRHGGIYMWGTIGLGVIPDKVRALAPDAPMDSWKLLLDPANAKRIAPCGIAMMDSAIDTIPSVLRYLGRDPNSTNAKDLADVEKTLMAIPPLCPDLHDGRHGGGAGWRADLPCDVLLRRRDPGGGAGEGGGPGGGEVHRPQGVRAAVVRHAGDAGGRAAQGGRAEADHYLWTPAVIAAISNKVQYANAVPGSLPMVDAAIRDNHNVYPTDAQMASFFTVIAPPQPPTGRARGCGHGSRRVLGGWRTPDRGLAVRYGALLALDGLDLLIEGGEMFVLLGGSGSGKTTLLRCLGGFIAPSAGRIVLGGQDITGLPPHRRPVNTPSSPMPVPAHERRGQRGVRVEAAGGGAGRRSGRGCASCWRWCGWRSSRHGGRMRLSGGQRQPRGAGPGAGAAAPAAAAGRADVGAGSLAARADARRTAAGAAGNRDHLRAGDARPGRGAVDGDADRAAAPWAAGAGGHARRHLRAAGDAVRGGVHGRCEHPGRDGAGGRAGRGAGRGGGGHGAGGRAAPLPAGAALHVALRPERLQLDGDGPNRASGLVEDIAYHGDTVQVAVRLPGGGALTVNRPLGQGAAAGVPERGRAATVAWLPDACVLLAS